MASKRATFSLDAKLADAARRLGVKLSAAAREGVEVAVGRAMVDADRAAYSAQPEEADDFWDKAEAWGSS